MPAPPPAAFSLVVHSIHVFVHMRLPMKLVTAVVCLPWLDCTDFADMVVDEERVRPSDSLIRDTRV